MNKKHLNSNTPNGFKIPDNYFEGLEEQLMSKITSDTLPKTVGFKMPDNYLETIESDVLSKINKRETKVIKLFTKKTFVTVSSIAAAIVLLFGLTWFTKAPTLGQLDNTTISNYVIDEIDDTDLSLFIDNYELSQTNYINYDLIAIEDYIDTTDLNTIYQE